MPFGSEWVRDAPLDLQLAVFYDGDLVVAAGEISEA